ncbi:sensor histidine kinase [Halobacillus salinus]|uniref:sensor histidine kinase n=1 Tax=Halobacillus salinus TaxID=192814 RepID=UPI0009A86061|nr:histidine kinase [Halobacillus salinus]
MNRIQSKLMVFFFILIFLMNGIAYYLYQGSQDTIRQYDHLLENFFLLNDVEQTTSRMYEDMTSYITKQSNDYYHSYQVDHRQLEQLRTELSTLKQNEVILDNYSNMITSFLEETDLAIRAYHIGEIETYSAHTQESERILSYIQDTTMTLINDELSNYDAFYRNLVERSHWVERMGISVFVFTLFASLLFAFRFSRQLTRPIQRLSRAARDISKGKLDGPDVHVKTNDEMKLLSETFNSMRKNLQQSIHEMKQKAEMQQLMKEMELKSLQNQVNPHFLFNTLNVIAKTSYMEEADKTGELIESVSSILRYNLSNLDHPATFKDEMESVRDYVFIQQARFGNRFAFRENIAFSTYSTPLPVLTLQPFIENAFIHGIENKEEGGTITVSSFEENGQVLIEICDDGVGIDSEQLERLNNREEDATSRRTGHTTGIGVLNSIRRLELMYEDHIVEIESTKGQGTTIRMMIPIAQTNEKREIV